MRTAVSSMKTVLVLLASFTFLTFATGTAGADGITQATCRTLDMSNPEGGAHITECWSPVSGAYEFTLSGSIYDLRANGSTPAVRVTYTEAAGSTHTIVHRGLDGSTATFRDNLPAVRSLWLQLCEFDAGQGLHGCSARV